MVSTFTDSEYDLNLRLIGRSQRDLNDGGGKKREIYFFSVFLGRRTAWMLGRTPPWAMVTPERSLFNSSSLRMASCK